MRGFVFPRPGQSATIENSVVQLVKHCQLKKSQLPKLFSERLRAAMDDRGLSQVQLARAAGVSKGTISNWLAGALPRSAELFALAKLFGVSMEWLLEAEPGKETTQEEADTIPIGQLEAGKLKHVLEREGFSLQWLQRCIEAGVERDLERRSSSMAIDKAAAMLEASTGMSGNLLGNLVDRVRRLARKRGVQSRLASDLGCSRQAVNNWLAGTAMPAAETALRLLQWVAMEEAKQQSPGSAETPPEPKTQNERKSNETSKSPKPKE